MWGAPGLLKCAYFRRRKQSYTIFAGRFARLQKMQRQVTRGLLWKIIVRENDDDSGDWRKRERWKNGFAGSGKEWCEASRNVSVGGRSSEGSFGNGDGDSG